MITILASECLLKDSLIRSNCSTKKLSRKKDREELMSLLKKRSRDCKEKKKKESEEKREPLKERDTS
jgi:hypothetical protein